MPETYTSAVWLVREGEESDFVTDWREFASWARTWPGCGTLRLVRDLEEPSRFLSFAPWESLETQRAWKDDDGFRPRIGRVLQHVEHFTPSTYALVADVE